LAIAALLIIEAARIPATSPLVCSFMVVTSFQLVGLRPVAQLSLIPQGTQQALCQAGKSPGMRAKVRARAAASATKRKFFQVLRKQITVAHKWRGAPVIFAGFAALRWCHRANSPDFRDFFRLA
jgi:hypothetical protein